MKDVLEGLRSKDMGEASASLYELEGLLRRSRVGAEAIGPLCELLSHGRDEERARAIWCLGKLGQNKIGDPRAIPAVLDFADDPSAENRENSAWAMGELAGAGVGDDASLSALIDMLDDLDDHVKAMASWSLGRYAQKLGKSDARCIERLEIMKGSSSSYLRKSAEFALELIEQGPSEGI